LIWSATLRDFDVYVATATRNIVSSYHASGKGHVKAL
jgi:hypothetical protein